MRRVQKPYLTKDTPAASIALMKFDGELILLNREETCVELGVQRTRLNTMIRIGEFPEGIPFSENGHIRRWYQHWAREFKRRKLAEAQERVKAELAEQERTGVLPVAPPARQRKKRGA